jgi:hypothetical protein
VQLVDKATQALQMFKKGLYTYSEAFKHYEIVAIKPAKQAMDLLILIDYTAV